MLFIPKGKRMTVAGRTGCGKTTLAAHVIKNSPGVWIVLDTKRDPFFKNYGYHIKQELENPLRIFPWYRKTRSPIIVPGSSEAADNDAWIYELHLNYENVGLQIDELYMVHENGRAGKGLSRWLTQGRALGQSYIGLTQRPAWVSQFCFSEADTLIGFDLNLRDDRKRMVDMTGQPEYLNRLVDHVFRVQTGNGPPTTAILEKHR